MGLSDFLVDMSTVLVAILLAFSVKSSATARLSTQSCVPFVCAIPFRHLRGYWWDCAWATAKCLCDLMKVAALSATISEINGCSCDAARVISCRLLSSIAAVACLLPLMLDEA